MRLLRLTALLLLLFPKWSLAVVTDGETDDSPTGAIPIAAEGAEGLALALRTALTHNPSIKAGYADLEEKRYAISSAKGSRFPTLSGQAHSDRDRFPQATIAVRQPLWAFGKIDTPIDQAQADFNAQLWGLRLIERGLIEDTAVAYAVISGIRQRAEVAANNVAEHESLHRRIERRYKGKLASRVDVGLSRSRLIQARSQGERIEGEKLVAFAQLEALTQIPVETEIPVDPRRTVLPPTPEVEALALENSADLHFQRLKLEVVRFDIKREKIASLPTLSARFEQHFVSARFEQDFVDQGNGVRDTRYGLVIEGSVEGLGLVSLGRVRGATARLKAAKHQVDATHNEVRRRVNTLMINRTVQQRLNRSQGAALEAVEATRSSFLRQYENGRKTWLELLNIQREVAALSFDLAQIQNDELILSLRVAAFTGGLDQLAGIEAL